MDYTHINIIIEQIDQSLNKQIILISNQLIELRKQIDTMEKLVEECKKQDIQANSTLT